LGILRTRSRSELWGLPKSDVGQDVDGFGVGPGRRVGAQVTDEVGGDGPQEVSGGGASERRSPAPVQEQLRENTQAGAYAAPAATRGARWAT